MSRVRVLWLVKGLGRGGAEQLLATLAGELDPQLVELHVGYVLPHKDALVDDFRSCGVTVRCLSPGRAPWAFALRALLNRESFDVVHTHSPMVAAAARVFAPAHTTLLHTEHNVWQRYRWPTRMMNRLTIHRNATVWAVSQGVADSIRARPGSSRPLEVEVLVHGIGAGGGPGEGPASRAEALDRLGLTPGPVTIGSVGNLRPKKDHGTLIRAFARVHVDIPDVRLVLIGGGPEEGRLRRLVHELGLDDAVSLTGVRDDVPQILPGLDVFAMSSRYEGLPVALLEAMAAGVAPVATAVGGIPEVIVDERDGLLVPATDPDRLSLALRRLVADPDLRAALGRAARERSGAFGIGPAAARISEAYRRHAPIAKQIAS